MQGYIRLCLVLVLTLFMKVAIAQQPGDDEVASVLGTRAERYDRQNPKRHSLAPSFGKIMYATDWKHHIDNDYSLGLMYEMPLGFFTALEIEGFYAKNQIQYTIPSGRRSVLVTHGFDQLAFGPNFKFYFTRHGFRPYAGLGLMALHYGGMQKVSRTTGRVVEEYGQWIGSGQAMLGADFEVTSGVAFGARASYMMPLLNRPKTADNGVFATNGFEEAAAINTGFFKFMGNVKVAL